MDDNDQNLWGLAQNICNTVLEFAPEIVIVLLNSAWIPFQGGLKLWQLTQREPFPPLVRLNLGREKHQRYDDSERPYASGCFIGLFASELEIASYLWFLESQTDWLEEIRQQIWIAHQGAEAPKRILIVDDWLAEGGTYILATGLLQALYPQSEVRFICGQEDWKSAISNQWLGRYYPRLSFLRETGPSQPGEGFKLEYMAEKQAIFRLIAGYEGLAVDSLDSRPIGPDSPILKPLLAYLPAEAWLKLPQYAEAEVLNLAQAYARFYRRRPWQPHPRAEISPLCCMLRDVLRDGSIRVDQARRRYKLETAVARRLLESKAGSLLERSGEGRKIHYRLAANAAEYI